MNISVTEAITDLQSRSLILFVKSYYIKGTSICKNSCIGNYIYIKIKEKNIYSKKYRTLICVCSDLVHTSYCQKEVSDAQQI